MDRATSRWAELLGALMLGLALPDGVDADPPWYAPDHVKVQLGGNVGVLSPGVGYALPGALEADLIVGWVPASMAGADLVLLTGKVTWLPWAVQGPRRWELRPLTLSAQVTYTLGEGEDFFIRPPERYEPGFFIVPPALRAGIGVGLAASGPLGGRVRGGFYVELVAVDVMLGMWIANPRTLRPWDVFSTAFGVRLEL